MESIIKRRDEEVDDTYSLLCTIMNDVNHAQEQELASDLSMGERAISQMLARKIDNEELVELITKEINSIATELTKDFEGWQKQGSVEDKIRVEIIKKLVVPNFHLNN